MSAQAKRSPFSDPDFKAPAEAPEAFARFARHLRLEVRHREAISSLGPQSRRARSLAKAKSRMKSKTELAFEAKEALRESDLPPETKARCLRLTRVALY